MLGGWLAASALAAVPGIALAQSPTVPAMSCAQAVAAFERDRVIMVRANGRTVVPVRVGIPVRLAGNLQCNGRGQMPRAYTVATTDQRRCVISIRC